MDTSYLDHLTYLIKVCEPHAENKALIEETFPYQFADIKVPKESPSQVVIRLLHPLSLWQIYWIGMQKGEGRIGPWYALENEMPC